MLILLLWNDFRIQNDGCICWNFNALVSLRASLCARGSSLKPNLISNDSRVLITISLRVCLNALEPEDFHSLNSSTSSRIPQDQSTAQRHFLVQHGSFIHQDRSSTVKTQSPHLKTHILQSNIVSHTPARLLLFP